MLLQESQTSECLMKDGPSNVCLCIRRPVFGYPPEIAHQTLPINLRPWGTASVFVLYLEQACSATRKGFICFCSFIVLFLFFPSFSTLFFFLPPMYSYRAEPLLLTTLTPPNNLYLTVLTPSELQVTQMRSLISKSRRIKAE